MKKIELYRTKLMELIDEAKMDGVEISPYEIKIEGYDGIIDTGIYISDGNDRIQLSTYKDGTIF